MTFFNLIHRLSFERKAWALLFSSLLALEAYALYAQYIMDIPPCIMCIYQRVALFGIMLGILPAVLRSNRFTLWVAMMSLGIGSALGVSVALEHYEMQTATNSFFAICEIVPNFPNFMPLHEWLPGIFAATGDCGVIEWEFLGMSMPQWMIGIFGFYMTLGLSLLISVTISSINKKSHS